MSNNGLKDDLGTQRLDINQSVAPGIYSLYKPSNDCEGCYPVQPKIRLQKVGNSLQKGIFQIDIESELNGLFRKNSRNPEKKYQPCCDKVSETTCQQSADENPNSNNCYLNNQTNNPNLKHQKECIIPNEDTRLSNPASTLRGTGWNRWEWLCIDPQQQTEIPFDNNISNRLIVKDNHRPLIPKPISQDLALPPPMNLPCEKTNNTCGNFTLPKSVHWQPVSEIEKY